MRYSEPKLIAKQQNIISDKTLDFVLQLLTIGDSIYNNCSSVHLKQNLESLMRLYSSNLEIKQ